MNEGILQSSPVQQMVAGGGNNWFTTSGSLQQHHSLLAAPPPPQNHHLAPPLTASSLSWTAASQELPQSWSQLVLGLAGEEDKVGISNWEQQLIMNNNINCSGAGDGYNAGNLEFTAARSSTNCSSLSPPMMSTSPPKSCVTTTSQNIMKGGNSNVNSSKKSKMNPTTSAQCGIKVRKEKLGDRITALHQIVSPFGKTDTASVLLEAIGYIRFLQRQIEALSLPYLASGSPSINHQQSEVKRERTNCRFPEDPGQLLNENQRKRKAISEEECEEEEEEAKKDLKSRGLCLVPLSCTLDFGSENGADYWVPSPSPSFAANFQ